MSDSGQPGFLSRWSQRKIQARENRLVRDEDQVAERTVATQAGQPLAEEPPTVNGPGHERPGRDRPGHDRPDVALSADGVASNTSTTSRSDAALPQAGGARENPLPGLDDVKLLTPESDFSPFMARGVAPAVKNAAMKKLFADPHFNVMDGLDIYIDDYTQREILPESMMRKMASSKFLKMFADEEDDRPSATAQPEHETGNDAGDRTEVPDQNYPRAERENFDPALTGMVSSPEEARTETTETGTHRMGKPITGAPDTVILPTALPQQEASAEFPGVRIPDEVPQAAAALGVSPGLPPHPATVQNRSEASRTSIVKSDKPLGDAPSDTKPHERSN